MFEITAINFIVSKVKNILGVHISYRGVRYGNILMSYPVIQFYSVVSRVIQKWGGGGNISTL